MSSTAFEQTRIQQLLSSYSPNEPPRLTLDFGDYLSLLWRIDRSAEMPNRARYYRRCAQALGMALHIQNRSLFRLVEQTEPGQVYAQICNAPYRGTGHLVDARDRKAAIAQLAMLRGDILRIGTAQQSWGGSWPGSGIIDPELRERVFAVLFTALQGQFGNFGRMLLVVDIVLGNLLLGFEPMQEVTLDTLVTTYHYPNPNDSFWRQLFYEEAE